MRYVILEHRQVGSVHWDLMLEQSYAPLRTWALEHCPPDLGWKLARELPPHREVYLVYEGPIDCSRGWVRRWDWGTYRLQTDEPAEVRVLLTGQRSCGLLELCRIDTDGARWRYRASSHWGRSRTPAIVGR